MPNPSQEFAVIKPHFRQQQNVRRLALGFTGQPRSGCNPAGVPPHHFEHEHLGRSLRHGGHVITRFAHRGGDIFRDRTKAWAAIGQRHVVINGFGDADHPQRLADFTHHLRQVPGRAHRPFTPVDEEITDIMRRQNRCQALIHGAMRGQRPEVETTRTERATRRLAQAGDVGVTFQAGIDQILAQSAQDTVAPGIYLADARRIGPVLTARFLDQAARRRIDDGGGAS